jgi:ParB/RepB/Spo0J family partition protein
MKLDISLIEPNHWNPNVMKEVDFEKLRREIAFTKSNQGYPIIVRKHPSLDGMYEIVDGEHRRKAMKELGIKEVWADVQILTDKEARLKTIKSNKFR